MQAIRARDTRPELAIRRELHRRGLRYRVNVSVPGMPRRTIDVAWKGRRVAVFIDGCYWHGCREHSSAPKVNSDYWGTKIENNRRRDRETGQFLQERGWVVMRLWEHESVKEVADAIELCVRSRT